MQVEPDTEIMQTDFSSQTRLKSSEVMRTLTSQAKGIQELLIDGFNDLPKAGQPATQRFGPPHALAALMRRRDQIDLLLSLPPSAWPLSRKAFVSHIGALSRTASTGQVWRWRLASGKQGRGQVLIMGAGRAEAKTSNHALSLIHI